MLGYRTGEAYTGAVNESLTGPIWEVNYQCDGSESNLNLCVSSGWRVSTQATCAQHENDAGTFCYKSGRIFCLIRKIKNCAFVIESTCSERDIVVTISVQWMCVRPCVHLFVCASVLISDFVQTVTSTIVDVFKNDLTQLSAITCRCAIWNICSGRPKVKVTHEGQIFVQSLLKTLWEKEKMLLTSILSYSHNVFLTFQRQKSFRQILFCRLQMLSIWQSPNLCSLVRS